MNETEEHIALSELFRLHPELATWLAEVLGLELPPGHTSHAADPAHKVTNLSADALTLVRDADNVTRLALPVEIQRNPDDDKPFTWPGYQWLERRRQRCKTRLLVIATSDATAARALQPIDDGDGNITTPLVVTRHTMPRITDPAEARAHPMRAVLSAAIHAGKPDGLPVARAALAALHRLPPASARRYSRLAFHKLKPNELHLLREEIMHATQEQPSEDPNEYANLLKEYFWDVLDERVAEATARAEAKVYARADAEATARANALAQPLAQSLAESRAQSLAALRDQSLAALRDQANILVRQLDSRGFRLDPDTITRIYGCQDTTQIELWQGRVQAATSLAEVFAP